MSIYKFLYQSPLGVLSIAANDSHLQSISFAADQEASKELPNIPPLVLAVQWLDSYFRGHPLPTKNVPTIFTGTDFQKLCWSELCRIPYGRTITYKDLADRVATKMGVVRMSCQAVGQAIQKNPFAILIPCHRVIGSKGDLTGYVWGLDLKRKLLNYEAKKCCD